ncbi:MAG TPA: DUF5916 domain-containing protein [Gemmatimonadales bacterium]|jgi:hypothetical protein
MMLPLTLLFQTATGSQVYSGLAKQTSVAIPRLEAAVVIDGRLDEPVWQRAALLTGFSQLQPVDGRPAEDTTQVLVWYGPNAIYFGIRAFESHGAVVATLADRDNIDANDYVQILLDTFNDRRRALVLGVNPFGIQADGIRSEGPPSGASGQQAGGNFANVDLNPDFQFESRGRLTDYGYEVEMRVPFKSIRYQATERQDWAIQILRKVTHSGYQNTWTPAVRANASFLTQSGTLEGLTDLQRGLVLDLNPFATTKIDGAPGAAPGSWAYSTTPAAGLNARWGLTTNLTLDGTINPDFSQVEADVAQVTVNQRFALFFPEKRPVFLEGIEQFDTPNSLIYTRQIVDPQGGIKLTGKAGGTNVAFLGAVDDTSTSATGSHPVFAITRIRTDLGGNSTTGLVYTGRFDGPDFNQVISSDLHVVFAKLFFFQLQAAASATNDASTGNATTWAPMWEGLIDCTARSWGCHWKITGFGKDFQTRSGFVPRTGVVNPFFNNRLTAYGAPGATLEAYTMFLTLQGIWDYDEFFQGKQGREFYANISNFFTLRGGWSVTFTPSIQSIAFDPASYTNYRTPSPFDSAGTASSPFTVPGRVTAPSFSLSGTTPNFQTLSATATLGAGKAVAFAEPSLVHGVSLSAQVDWRPTGQLRIGGLYNHQTLNRVDGSRLSTADIPRLKVEYQLARPVFVRFIGQYSAQSQDSLRDPVSGAPIYVVSNTIEGPAYSRAAAQVSNAFTVNWLFSYHPNPGTVLYAGYGSSLTEPDAFAFRNLNRANDGFFFKLSYLFRM